MPQPEHSGGGCATRIIFISLHIQGDVAQLARALAWHARGRGFESHLLHKKSHQLTVGFFLKVKAAI